VDLLGAKMEIPVKQTLHSILASAKGTHIKGLSVRGKAQIPAKKLPRGGLQVRLSNNLQMLFLMCVTLLLLMR
jgi:hypothetical protein